jgi:plastocyanin domain-containing protein
MSRRKKHIAPAPSASWLQSTAFTAIAAIALVAVIVWAVFLVRSDGTLDRTVTPADDIGAVEFDGVTQILRMTATDGGYTPNEFQVEAGKPVRLIIDGEARGCASYFTAPKLGISQRLEIGDGNVFEFTPTAGRYDFSCSMGMFSGVIVAA